MKTINLVYEGTDQLNQLVLEYGVNNYEEILIQVFTSMHKFDDIRNFVNEIRDIIPNGKIVGTTSSGVIYNREVRDNQCIISISLFDNATIHLEYTEDAVKMASINGVSIAFFSKSYQYSNTIYEASWPCVGGVSDVNLFLESFVFGTDFVSSSGIVIAHISYIPKIINHCIRGLESVGVSRTVTSVEGNQLKAINTGSAKQWYLDYLNKLIIGDHVNKESCFPLVRNRDGNQLIYPVEFHEDSEYLFVSAKLTNGDNIKIGYINREKITKDMIHIHEEMEQSSIESLMFYSDLIKVLAYDLIFSSDRNNIDVLGVLMNKPIVQMNGKNVILDSGISILGISEEGAACNEMKETQALLEADYQENEDIAINWLLRKTNKELDEANHNLLEKINVQQELLKHNLFKDELTQLYNMDRLKYDLQGKQINKLALLDIQDFALINNLYGSEIGNMVIIEFANFLRDYGQKNDIEVYRVNVDVFAMVCENKLEEFKFLFLIRELMENLNRFIFKQEDHELYLNVVVSVVINEERLLEKANLTLDYVKRKKKSIQIYHKNLKIEEEIENNMLWIRKIKKAIEEDRIVTYFQPIHNNRTGQFDKYEVLIRMIDEDGSIISPGSFLDIAKKANLYRQLTKIVVNRAFNSFANKDLHFAINITVDDIVDIKTKNYILYKLSTFWNPKNVIFEIVETEGIENYPEVKSFIEQAKRQGAQIAIDDFGTGYSNLVYLTQLDIDFLKIDGSIIRKLNKDDSSNVIAKTVLYLTKSLGINTIAEYVENEAIYECVKALDIDYSQGYYFSKPLEKPL